MKINRMYSTKEGVTLASFEQIAFFDENKKIQPTKEFVQCWEDGGHGPLDVFKLVKKNFNDGTSSYRLHAISDWSGNRVSFVHDVMILSMSLAEYNELIGEKKDGTIS